MAQTKKCGHEDIPGNVAWQTRNGKREKNGCKPCATEKRRIWAAKRRRAAGVPERPIRQVVEGIKRCQGCGVDKSLEDFYPRWDRPDGYSRGRAARCKKCEAQATAEWRARNPDDARRINRETGARVRYEALLRYSPAGSTTPTCCCCGTEGVWFLALDHINSDGNDHRSALKSQRVGTNIARALKRDGWPEGVQVLCHNCNWAKFFLGGCPHSSDEGRAAADSLTKVVTRPPLKRRRIQRAGTVASPPAFSSLEKSV